MSGPETVRRRSVACKRGKIRHAAFRRMSQVIQQTAQDKPCERCVWSSLGAASNCWRSMLQASR
eukprot:10749873-Alexandrium_andersonii.AAC.1